MRPLRPVLRHGVEGPVVDVAGDHQHQRERRRDHPIVVLAAGIQQRHRGARILRQPPRHRAAAGAAAHHHEIECIRHACFPLHFFVYSVIARSKATKQSILSFVARWIASRSLSSGAHSRDPLARNDGVNKPYDMNRIIFSSRAILRAIGRIEIGEPVERRAIEHRLQLCSACENPIRRDRRRCRTRRRRPSAG